MRKREGHVWIDAKFALDEIEDCVLHIPDPLADDAKFAQEEPYVHWNDVVSCISLAVLLAKDGPFNKRFDGSARRKIKRPKPLGVETRPRPLSEYRKKKREGER